MKMTEKDKLIKELIINNPKVSANKLYLDNVKGSKTLGKRKSDFLKIVREVRKLPEPTIEKKEKSIPIKHRPAKRKPKKRVIAKPKEKIEVKEPKAFKKLTVKEQELLTRKLTPKKEKELTKHLTVKQQERLLKEKVESKQERFEKSRFGKIQKKVQKKQGINELDAIERTRALLKLPKSSYKRLNKKDREVLSHFGY